MCKLEKRLWILNRKLLFPSQRIAIKKIELFTKIVATPRMKIPVFVGRGGEKAAM